MKEIKFRVPQPTDRMLIALQFWKGDAKQAYRLSRLLADLEPEHQDKADFLFFSRFDTPIDPKEVYYVSRKFDTLQARCRRQGVGHPYGCNELWLGLWEWVAGRQAQGHRYKMVFTCESDGAPGTRNWISKMHALWDEVQPASVVGSFQGDHINGNAMFSGHPAFVAYLTRKVVSIQMNAGWDYVLWKVFKQWGAAGVSQVRSYWQTPTMSRERFDAEVHDGAVWIHGVKDNTLLEHSRAALISS